ncbi:MAG: type 4a pilus biogenesis protein PilO [Thermoguttaceae bacterium]
MTPTPGQERRADTKSQLLEQLHDPTRLRFIVAAAVLGIGYIVVYLPLDRSTTAATRKLADSETRLALADDVEHLRNQYRLVEKRLPARVDADEWVQYVLGAIRRSPLRLNAFSPSVVKPLGPYQMVYLSIKLSGPLADLDGFLSWLESNERLFRVETLSLSPKSAEGNEFNMDIAVLGVMG